MADRADGVLGGQHVPGSVGSKDKTAVLCDVDRVHSNIWLGTDYKHIFLAVVGPQVPEGSGHGEEGDFVDVRGPTDWTLVAHPGPVPDHPGHSGLADHLPAAGVDSLALLCKINVTRFKVLRIRV